MAGKRALPLPLACVLALFPAAAPASEFPTLKPRLRVQVDTLLTEQDSVPRSGVDLRRLYLGLEGKLSPRLRFSGDVDFGGDEATPQDIFLAYKVSDRTEILVGYLKPFNVNDEITSDVFILFLERSLYSGAFAPGRRNGAATNVGLGTAGLQLGFFSGRGTDFLKFERPGGHLLSGRLYNGLPVAGGTLHLAASAYREDLPGDTLRLQLKPETSMVPALLDTGAVAADHALFTGIESGFGKGPLTVQAEAGRLALDGASSAPAYWGGSFQISYRWTGEERPYSSSSGTFGRVTPAQAIGKAGLGAIETGLRFSHVDLETDEVSGGRLSSYGAVLNWYPVRNLRVSANLIHADPEGSPRQRSAETLVTLRAGFDW